METTEVKTEKQYSSKNWCDLVAWLINCDNKKFKFNERIYTAESCWHCNSHGELFGILGAIRAIQKMMIDKAIKQEFSDKWQKILDGEELEATEDNASGLGMYCVTMMWRCPKEFEDFVHKLLFN